MSYTIDPGYTRPVASKNLAIADWDFTVFTDPISSGTDRNRKFTYQNKTSDLDRRMRVEVTRREIEDIYKGSGIAPINRSPITKGVQLTIAVRSIDKIDDGSGNAPIYGPSTFSTQITKILHPAVTASQILTDLKDHIGIFFPTDSVTANQLAEFIVGGSGLLDETTP